jgi:hypothetical protein
MKLTEKILRAPLPDQLKALLEKFDAEFDASHLRMLRNLANESSLTRYERFMLKRTHHKAQMELNRAETLDAAMSIVLNRGDKGDDSMFDAQRYMMMPSGKSVMVPIESLYGGALVGGTMQSSAGLQNAAGQQSTLSQYAQGLRMHP